MPDAPTLFPTDLDNPEPPGRGKHGYYRRGDTGWVTVGATTPANRGHYEYKGFVFLSQYGEFVNGTAGGAKKERDARGALWNPADEPWRLIFQRGGAKEFPVSQIIAYRWHVRPPYKEVTFPQLESVKVYDFQCPECTRGLFSSTVEADAVAQLKVHLTSGVNNQHSYTPTDLRALAQEWGLDFESRRIGTNPVRRVHDQTPEPDAPELTPVTLLSCEECGWAPKPDAKKPEFALMLHKRSHGTDAAAGDPDLSGGDGAGVLAEAIA